MKIYALIILNILVIAKVFGNEILEKYNQANIYVINKSKLCLNNALIFSSTNIMEGLIKINPEGNVIIYSVSSEQMEITKNEYALNISGEFKKNAFKANSRPYGWNFLIDGKFLLKTEKYEELYDLSLPVGDPEPAAVTEIPLNNKLCLVRKEEIIKGGKSQALGGYCDIIDVKNLKKIQTFKMPDNYTPALVSELIWLTDTYVLSVSFLRTMSEYCIIDIKNQSVIELSSLVPRLVNNKILIVIPSVQNNSLMILYYDSIDKKNKILYVDLKKGVAPKILTTLQNLLQCCHGTPKTD